MNVMKPSMFSVHIRDEFPAALHWHSSSSSGCGAPETSNSGRMQRSKCHQTVISETRAFVLVPSLHLCNHIPLSWIIILLDIGISLLDLGFQTHNEETIWEKHWKPQRGGEVWTCTLLSKEIPVCQIGYKTIFGTNFNRSVKLWWRSQWKLMVLGQKRRTAASLGKNSQWESIMW